MSEPRRYLLDTSAVIDLPTPAQIAEYLISSITLLLSKSGRADQPADASVDGGEAPNVKAFGVHATSDLTVKLGGACERFTAIAGIDDDPRLLC